MRDHRQKLFVNYLNGSLGESKTKRGSMGQASLPPIFVSPELSSVRDYVLA